MKTSDPLDNRDSKQEGTTLESAASDQDVLLAIERICGDDFCEEMDMRDGLDSEFTDQPDLQTAIRKLGAIYRLSHAYVRAHTCYHVHNDWRAGVKPAGLSNSAPNTDRMTHPESKA